MQYGRICNMADTTHPGEASRPPAGRPSSRMAETAKRPTKKQLKTSAFRSKKKIKELLEEKSQALPEQDEEDNQPEENTKASKKRKREKTQPEEEENEDEKPKPETIVTTASKRRKRKNAAKLKEKEEIQKRKSSKLILFVGNLPFDISVERLKSFFSEHCGEEPSVRLMTPKTSQSTDGKPPATKGCGFIEFESSAALQKALRLHHTPLSAETGGPANSRENVEKKARKINIELTAGGGGSSENRRLKIRNSLQRLAKQRDKILEKRIKSSSLEKANSGQRTADPQFDVSIKRGSRPNPLKKSTRQATARFKPHSSGANAIKLG
ncbi:hypothetical protein PtA15_16A203 [Puccinia triticina]|uniref:RRM domain-containing protein n=1 Tax=Puccinia triticina TaxID=208348 RepID=A0ABY7D7N6_9BASI|nr:uncharacterized protein PtA15_16A203 [Puccinia triticina]WAQ92297.1 hypothetical protein PtA15_16A203 [Puccinia triticina]WAR64034.1 hypothetical protein PtB15_16B193 [Puccinia triticina]